MGRINVVVDDGLVERVRRLYGLRTAPEAIEFALRRLVGDKRPRDMLDLEGAGWGGDLEEMRAPKTPEI